MIINDIKDFRVGEIPVKKIFLGSDLIWGKSELFLTLNPTTIWLTEANDYTEIVNVLSNTDWTVK